MKRFTSIVSCAVLALGLAAGCKKKEEAKKEDPAAAKAAEGAAPAAADPAAAAPAAADPAAAAADPAAAAPAAAGAEPTAEEKDLAEKAVGMMEEIATAAEGAAGDCKKAAASMQPIVDKNKDIIAKGKEMDKDPAK